MIAYDTRLLIEWDHTSMLAAGIYNLTCIVINAMGGKGKAKVRPASYFHPYREKQQQGLRVTPSNINDLRVLGNALMASR